MGESEANEGKEQELQIPAALPLLALRDIVVFPFMIVPLYVSREKSIKAVDQALTHNRMILLVAQREGEKEDLVEEDIYKVGTVAMIMRMLKLPDNRIRVLVQGLARASLAQVDMSKEYMESALEILNEPEVDRANMQTMALVRNVKAILDRATSLGKQISPEIQVVVQNMEDPGRLADLIASNFELKVAEAQEVLEVLAPVDRLQKVHSILNREVELLTIQQQISTQAKGEMDKVQREYFMRQQLKAIQQELGEGNELAEEIKHYHEKVAKAKMPSSVEEEVERQIKKLERMHPDSAETATIRNYLDWMVDLPWSVQTEDNLDIAAAHKILDEDHYGLEKVKERILEYLAVRKLKDKMKGPILCFVGPPGVGKTSLGRSIARALGRKFYRMSLGGVRDEAEIRGHRRTYVGAMPGRIVQGIHTCGSSNPVFMLDEVDKIGADFRGDPSSALLEVLDPEQNFSFRDHYLGVPFDLSNVMFITTANLLDPIHPAFRDRMEVIFLSGYTEEEKIQIGYRHIIPKQMQENGILAGTFRFGEGALRRIIGEYTREAGLRNFEREVASICRKVARRIAEGKEVPKILSGSRVEKLLGPPRIFREETMKKDRVGVATGLAWTATGGDVLFIEATVMKGKGSLLLTGHLGEVMKESAHAALSFSRTHAAEFEIPDQVFGEHDIHVHIPEGSIPKDGPSAGITMAVAMISALTNQSVRHDIAMTGEITLRGTVLPIGGVKEKVLAARRAGVRKVILPAQNRKDLDDIPPPIRREMSFIFTEEVSEVLKEALVPKAPAAPTVDAVME
ncbi:MAG: endopeptidase La [Acidobacteriota bacterium]